MLQSLLLYMYITNLITLCDTANFIIKDMFSLLKVYLYFVFIFFIFNMNHFFIIRMCAMINAI